MAYTWNKSARVSFLTCMLIGINTFLTPKVYYEGLNIS